MSTHGETHALAGAKNVAGKAGVAGAAGGPTVKGVSYLKDVPEPPQLPADQYPPWLHALAEQRKASVDALKPQDGKVYFKKANLVQIKKTNFLKDNKR